MLPGSLSRADRIPQTTPRLRDGTQGTGTRPLALSPSRPRVWLSDSPVTRGLWESRGVQGRAGAEIQVCGLQTLLFPRNMASSLLRLDFLCSVLLGMSFLPLPSVPAQVLLLQLIPDAHLLSVLPTPPHQCHRYFFTHLQTAQKHVLLLTTAPAVPLGALFAQRVSSCHPHFLRASCVSSTEERARGDRASHGLYPLANQILLRKTNHKQANK